MSDEKRRAELMARINDHLDKLSIDDLEKFAGGIIGFPTIEKPAYCMNCNSYFIGYSAGSRCPNCEAILVRG